jgi:uncharacterized membrane protein
MLLDNLENKFIILALLLVISAVTFAHGITVTGILIFTGAAIAAIPLFIILVVILKKFSRILSRKQLKDGWESGFSQP